MSVKDQAAPLPRKLLIAVALIFAAIVLPIYLVKVHQKVDYTDFDVYYRAASRAAAGNWGGIYDPRDGASPYRYMPLFLPLFRPFAGLDLADAHVLWYLIAYLSFVLGFVYLYRTLRLSHVTRPTAASVTALSALMILRLCLDTFTSGQVSAVMFLCFMASLYSYCVRRPGRAGAWLLLPTLFKIGPGILYGIFALGPRRIRRPALWTSAAIGTTFAALATLWIGPWERARALWSGWIGMVRADSSYYDASHYGSQSLKSALLRLANRQVLSLHAAETLHLVIAACGCAALAAFWLFRRPSGARSRALFFALGLFAYMWFMPETFKYSLTPMALPIALLLTAPKKGWLHWLSLASVTATISLAGKDVVGDAIFFPLQKMSLPFLATLLSGITIAVDAWKSSRRAHFLGDERITLGPWPRLPVLVPELEASVLIPLPLTRTSLVHPELLAAQVHRLREVLEPRYGEAFEILIIPYGELLSEFHPSLGAAQSLMVEDHRITMLSAPACDGRGAAL
ncbi:MAG: glycosyltransferase family 87 protein, partial [Bdellovibrionota bacterium]